MGWVRVIAGNRDTPRMSELALDQRALLLRREQLLGQMRNAAAFIRIVFNSSELIWVERCASIIQ